MKFKTGDLVRMIGCCAVAKETRGVVLYCESNYIGVKWENFYGHSGLGQVCKCGRCWNVDKTDIELIKRKT